MISLLTPTRERPDRFKKMYQSAKQMADGEFEVVAVLNKEDPTADRYPKADNISYVRVPKPADNKLSGLWNEAAKNASGDILMMCADDFVFTAMGWDRLLEGAFAAVPDGIVMVYGNDGSPRRAPIAPAVTRKWFEICGEFTPKHLQGWFSDEWIWSIAAELHRVIYIPELTFTHEQAAERDPALMEQVKQRGAEGGIDGMRRAFYSAPEVRKRDERVAKLRRETRGTLELIPVAHDDPDEAPGWYSQSLSWAAGARIHERNAETLIVVHCWKGDADLVKEHMPLYKHHDRPVLILSPEDSPVNIQVDDVMCKSIGKRAYYGQDSLDRQALHLKYLLTLPYEYFLLNDADSFCLSPDIPSYLYMPGSKNILWSNEVGDWRTHPSPYPKLALHPPYFMHRSVLARLVSVMDKPEVRAHPITPYIDWYMLALAHEAGVPHQTFPDGASFPAWRRNIIAETQQLGHDYKHRYEADGAIRGDDIMAERVARGGIFIHSVKHKPVKDRLVNIYRTTVTVANNPVERVSILVPFRSEMGNDTRDRVWKWVKQRWAMIAPDAEIVMGTDKGGMPFSKTCAVNDAFLKATGDVMVVADADAWMEEPELSRAIEIARRTQRLVVPWKTVVRLNEEDSKKIMRKRPTTKNLGITDQMRADAIETCVPETAGTLFIIVRDSFEKVQGMDPRFRGWGMEDVALSRACETLLGPNVYLDHEVYSLYHPRPVIKSRGRVWEQDVGMAGIDLAKAYSSAHRNPGAMRALVDQHPLRGVTGQLVPTGRDERSSFAEFIETRVQTVEEVGDTIRIRI